jgi:preprotein translocase subunit SecF
VHTGGVDAVGDFLLVVIFALIAIALVVALVFQWRDDHKGLGRRMR